MIVQLTLQQTNTIEDGPIYKVKNEITSSLVISEEVFVFVTETQEFSNVASIWEEMNLPVGHAAAVLADADRYRMAIAEVGYSSVVTALAFADYIRVRLEALVIAYDKYIEDFEGTAEHIYTAGS